MSDARLLREAHALAQLSHPNVIGVYDVGTFEDDVFMAMELVEGATLREWWKQKKRHWRETTDVMLAAGKGLAAAHQVKFHSDSSSATSDGLLAAHLTGLSSPISPTLLPGNAFNQIVIRETV